MTDPLTIAGLTAFATLIATELAHFGWSRRTNLMPPRVPPSGSGVQPAHRGARAVATGVAGRSAAPEKPDFSALAALLPESTPADEPPPRRPLRALIYINAPEQVREFLDHMTAEGYARSPVARDPRQGCYSHEVWWGEYRSWAEARSIVSLTQDVFKSNMKRHPRIAVTRDRVKDRHGSVIKTAGGSPLRATNYTLFERAPVEAVTTDAVTGRTKRILVQPHEVKQLKRKAA